MLEKSRVKKYISIPSQGIFSAKQQSMHDISISFTVQSNYSMQNVYLEDEDEMWSLSFPPGRQSTSCILATFAEAVGRVVLEHSPFFLPGL